MDEDLETPAPEPEDNAVIRGLREQARGADAARAEADSLRRELAFTKAGIDPSDVRQRYFVQGYAGELTADAIRAEAEAAGFLGTVDTSAGGITAAERAAFEASTQAASGQTGDAPLEDIYAPFRNQTYRHTGESPESFGSRLAQTVAQHGGEVAFEGPFREFPGDTGIVPRPNTPLPRRI